MSFASRKIFRSRQLFVVIILLAGAVGFGQSTSSPAQPAQQADNRIFAELDHLTHAKRVKSGETVTAHLIAPAKLPDGTELPKGTKLVGTITDVKAKADKEGPSKLGLLFTTVAPKSGKETTVSMVLITVAPHTQQNDVDLLSAGNPFSGGGRMQAGTATSTLNTTSNEGEALSRGLGARAPASHDNVAPGQLQPGKSYVPDVVMVSYSTMSPGTVLESKNGSVYLDAGVRLLLVTK
jgi:hypothetical protein